MIPYQHFLYLVSISMTNLDLLPSLYNFKPVCGWPLCQFTYGVFTLIRPGKQCLSTSRKPLVTGALDSRAVTKSVGTRLLVKLVQETFIPVRSRDRCFLLSQIVSHEVRSLGSMAVPNIDSTRDFLIESRY